MDEADVDVLMWGDSPEGRAYFDAIAKLEREGWAESRRGEQPPPPEGTLTLEDVARFPLGSRVRMIRTTETMSGIGFPEGEELTIVEHRLAPIGCVFMQARTDDGRVLLTGTGKDWSPVG